MTNSFIDALGAHKAGIASRKVAIWGAAYLGREMAFHLLSGRLCRPENLVFIDRSARERFSLPVWVCGCEFPVSHPDEFGWNVPGLLLILAAGERDAEGMGEKARANGVPDVIFLSRAMAARDRIDVPGLHSAYERFYGRESDETMADVWSRALQLREMERAGLLSPDDIRGKRVLDWECGAGTFSRLFFLLGAREVVGSDTLAPVDGIPVKKGESIRYERCGIAELSDGRFDLVFSNTVTEHIQDLPDAIRVCHDKLTEGGMFLTTHDNYYSPRGSHDHRFLGLKDMTCIPIAPPCYDTGNCAVSGPFRKALESRYVPTGMSGPPQSLAVEDAATCADCWYRRRSRPWAHLLCQDDFLDVFSPSFRTGHAGSFLNKITPFQLAQFIVEAGLRLEGVWKSYFYNPIPEELLDPCRFPISREDLLTWVVRVRAVKGLVTK